MSVSYTHLGDTVEIWPAYWKDTAIRVEFFGDEIDRISEINVVTGTPIRRLNNIPIDVYRRQAMRR